MFEYLQPLNLITVATLFGILQGVLIIFVFTQKKRYKQHKYLILFLIAVLIAQSHSFLMRSGMMFETLWLMNSNVPVLLLLGPFIYFYTLSAFGKPNPPIAKAMHLLPFFFYFIYSFNFFLQDPAFKFNILVNTLGLDIPLKSAVQLFPFDPWDIQGWVVVELLSLHLFLYGILSVWVIHQSSKDQDSKQQKSTRRWLIFNGVMLSVGGLFLFLAEGGVINGYVFFESPISIPIDLFSSIALYAIAIYVIAKPDIIKGQNGQRYSKSSLSESYKKSKLRLIINLIEKEKLYLDPAFSLDLISQRSNVSKHHVSQIINEELGCTFFELTNNFRIEEAKRVLENVDYIKLEQLAIELGYRSKSSFYSAFKKATQHTPFNYMNSIRM